MRWNIANALQMITNALQMIAKLYNTSTANSMVMYWKPIVMQQSIVIVLAVTAATIILPNQIGTISIVE